MGEREETETKVWAKVGDSGEKRTSGPQVGHLSLYTVSALPPSSLGALQDNVTVSGETLVAVTFLGVVGGLVQELPWGSLWLR